MRAFRLLSLPTRRLEHACVFFAFSLFLPARYPPFFGATRFCPVGVLLSGFRRDCRGHPHGRIWLSPLIEVAVICNSKRRRAWFAPFCCGYLRWGAPWVGEYVDVSVVRSGDGVSLARDCALMYPVPSTGVTPKRRRAFLPICFDCRFNSQN